MIKMLTAAAAPTAVGLLLAGVAACGPTNTAGISDGNTPPGSFGAHASSLATSSQAAAARKAGKAALAGCQPAGDSTIQWQGQLALYPSARVALENCLGVKGTAERKALGKCVLRVAQAELSGSGPLAPREVAFLANAQKQCVK